MGLVINMSKNYSQFPPEQESSNFDNNPMEFQNNDYDDQYQNNDYGDHYNEPAHAIVSSEPAKDQPAAIRIPNQNPTGRPQYTAAQAEYEYDKIQFEDVPSIFCKICQCCDSNRTMNFICTKVLSSRWIAILLILIDVTLHGWATNLHSSALALILKRGLEFWSDIPLL